MKRLILLVVLLAGFCGAKAQVFDYGNGWYAPSNQYLKLMLEEDGIYRLTSADLVAAGFDTSSVDPYYFHLLYRGVEEPLHIEYSGSNWTFLEFYGQPNDGKLDSAMYRSPYGGTLLNGDYSPNIRRSLFTDTSAYFLTWDNTPGIRYNNLDGTNYASYTPETHFRYESFTDWDPDLYPGAYWARYNLGGGGKYDVNQALNSDYVPGEGYLGPEFEYGYPYTDNIATPHPANLGNPSDFAVRLYRKSSNTHFTEVRINGSPVIMDSTFGIHINTFSFPYSPSLSPNNPIVFNALYYDPILTDVNHVVWYSMTYDRLFFMDGANMIKMKGWNKASDAYFQFQDADITSEGWVYDRTYNTRSRGVATGTTFNVVVPGGAQPRNLIVATDKSIKTPTLQLSPALANLSGSTGAEFVIIAHRSLSASAEAYAQYRDTCSVNPMSVKVVYVDEIYNEFGYGSITPWAIKRFCKWSLDNWSVKPKFFFLWGKGGYQTRRDYASITLVPTCGAPASDWTFVSDYYLDTVDLHNLAAIGRFNAVNDEQGMAYLDKVNEYEHSAWEPWMKEAVYLGGGEAEYEQIPIKSYLVDNYLPAYEAPLLGGKVYYYQNFNTGVITNSPTIGSKQRIDDGKSLIHFFGHSSDNIYDVDIQEPDRYTNYGKYPLIVAFGCYGGDFTTPDGSFGERFVAEAGRGSIGYLANSTAGYLGPLGQYGKYFYDMVYHKHLGDPVGQGIAASLDSFHVDLPNQNYHNHIKQMNLQGDPSITLYTPRKPDLAIDESSIFFEPPYFSASDTAFTINVITRNEGLATADSFYLSIRQQLPDGTWITYPKTKHAPITHADTLQYNLVNTVGATMAGLNYFDVFVDSTNLLDEYDETNNRLLHPQVIQGNVPAILYPYDFAVVPSSQVSLSAATYVITGPAPIHYVFEIDTSYDFNSPLWSSQGISPVVTGTALLGQWEVPFNLVDSTVYYWRVRIAEVLPPAWASASFKYIDGRKGWAQSRPPQFFKDATTSMSISRVNYDWSFDPWHRDLHIFGDPGMDANYKMSNGVFSSNLNSYGWNGILHTPIDYRTLIPGYMGTVNGDWDLDILPDDEVDLRNSIMAAKHGDYYMVASNRTHNYRTWKPEAKAALVEIGVDTSRLGDIATNQTFYLIGRKGYPGSAQMLLEPNLIDSTGLVKYDLFTTISSVKQAGKIYSTTVGASIRWYELIWNWKQLDQMPGDDVRINVFARKKDGTDSLIFANIGRGTYDLSTLDADKYPWIHLDADAADSIYLTSPELTHWHVLFEPAPDAAVDPIARWSFVRDTVMEGDAVTVTYNMRNLTDTKMDSMLVRYVVQREDRSNVEVGLVRYDSLRSLASQEVSFTFNTGGKNLGGLCNFMIEINPNDDQPEQHHFNNLYSHNFRVVPDRLNPILDVTFDGKHLMDGDIISPNAEILIQINDENEFLAVNDTAFEIYFGEGVSPFSLPRINIDGNPNMTVVSATLPDNKARLTYRPGPLADGDYTLKVQGYDYNGNAAGKSLYEIHFKVVNEVAVSNVVNYPNPFSTSTRFAYTLTGGETPEVFDIQIYTITGKLVKVIDLLEQGEVRQGYNLTTYAWDGRDDFGDLLANGVYVYKVNVKSGGKDLKIRDEGMSTYFDNGYGKLYIMR
jgi:flagellar hook assembly protein FlgD